MLLLLLQLLSPCETQSAEGHCSLWLVLLTPVTPQVVAPHSVQPPVYPCNPYPLQSGLIVHTPPPTASQPPPYSVSDYQPAVNPNYKG